MICNDKATSASLNADGLGSGAGLRCKDVHTEETSVTEGERLDAPLPPLRPLEDEQDWGANCGS